MDLRLTLQGSMIQAVMGLTALRTGQRPTHPTGIGAAGLFVASPDRRLPAHDFFADGATYPVRLRHATVELHDDAGMDVRSASIKFSESQRASPLDIVMNSGEASAYANATQFFAFTRARKRGGAGALAYRQTFPEGFESGIDRLRRAPDSFASLRYHSQVCFQFHARDRFSRLIRYRLVPAGDEPESGMPSRKDREAFWAQPRLPEETRPTNYLREEFRERIAMQPVEYRLQAQLHERRPGESTEIFNATRPWDEERSPWLLLGTATFDRALSDSETDALSFSLAHQPGSLGVIPATSPEDYNSIVYLRIRAYRAGYAARTARHKLDALRNRSRSAERV